MYNSLRSAKGDVVIGEVLKSYSVFLPLYLDVIGFFEGWSDLNFSCRAYASKKHIEPLYIEMVDGLPTQMNK